MHGIRSRRLLYKEVVEVPSDYKKPYKSRDLKILVVVIGL